MSKLSNSIININEIKQILQTKALPPREKDIYEGEYSGSGKISHSKLYGNTKTIGQILGIIKSAKGNDYGDYDGSFEGDGELVGGYTLNFYNQLTSTGLVMYSTDGGLSWMDLYNIKKLTNIKQVMFKCGKSSEGSTYGSLNSTKLNLNLQGVPGGISESSNITLTEDVSDIVLTQVSLSWYD